MNLRISKPGRMMLMILTFLLALTGCAVSSSSGRGNSDFEAVSVVSSGEVSAYEDEANEETQEEATGTDEQSVDGPTSTIGLSEDGTYTSKEEVAAYLFAYGHLPSNFITKNKAQDLGWDSQKGNLNDVAPGMSIGGDRFGNREGLLPKKKGRQYYECDIDYRGGRRNAKRIVFSDDGLIYYTEDHYSSFELLYGEE